LEETEMEPIQNFKAPLLQSDLADIRIEDEEQEQKTLHQASEYNSDEVHIAEHESAETPQQVPVAIVLGSFIDTRNADRMEKNLVRKGFQVYRGAGPVEFNRVGYLLKDGEDVEKLLIKFKKEIVFDAWVLYPADMINRNAAEELIGHLGAIIRPESQEEHFTFSDRM